MGETEGRRKGRREGGREGVRKEGKEAERGGGRNGGELTRSKKLAYLRRRTERLCFPTWPIPRASSSSSLLFRSNLAP